MSQRTKKNILEGFELDGPKSLTFIDDTDVAKLFLRSLQETEVGQRIQQKGLWNSDNLDAIVERATLLGGPEFTFAQFVAAATMLERLGKLVEPEVEPEPEIERDSLGRPITEAQRRFQAMVDWCNSKDTSMRMIEDRRRTDPQFAKFYSEQNRLRLNENRTDAVTEAGAPTERVHPNDQLRDFAELYTAAPSQSLRPRNGEVLLPGIDNGKRVIPGQRLSIVQFNEKVSAATNAGLI